MDHSVVRLLGDHISHLCIWLILFYHLVLVEDLLHQLVLQSGLARCGSLEVDVVIVVDKTEAGLVLHDILLVEVWLTVGIEVKLAVWGLRVLS